MGPGVSHPRASVNTTACLPSLGPPLCPGPLRVLSPAPSASWVLTGLQAASSVKPACIIPALDSDGPYLVLPRDPC